MVENQEIGSKTDQELVALTLENQDNFLYIVNRYEKKLLSFILRISNVPLEDAQDFLQEIFIKVYQNLNDVDPSLKFSSWIYRVTRNHVISHYRKYKVRPHAVGLDVNDEVLQNIASEFDTDRHIDNQFARTKIMGVLSRLDSKYREVIILRFFEDKNYQEISDIIKKPINTVGTLLNRAKKQFKEQYHI